MIELHEEILDWFYNTHKDAHKPLYLIKKVAEVKEFHQKMLRENKRNGS